MIEISFIKYFNVFEALDVVLGPGNHLRSGGSTRAFICTNKCFKNTLLVRILSHFTVLALATIMIPARL